MLRRGGAGQDRIGGGGACVVSRGGRVPLPPPRALRASAARRRGGAALLPSRALALPPSPAVRSRRRLHPAVRARLAVVGIVGPPPRPVRLGGFPLQPGLPLRVASPAVGGERSEFRPLCFTLSQRVGFPLYHVSVGFWSEERCCAAVL